MELAKWQATGSHEVFHYLSESYRLLKYDFVEDCNRYETDGLKVTMPTLLFYGKRDEVIPVDESRKFFRDNSEFVQYHELDGDHDLLDVLGHMWSQIDAFMAVNAAGALSSVRSANLSDVV